MPGVLDPIDLQNVACDCHRDTNSTPCQRRGGTEPLGIWPMLTKYTFIITKITRARLQDLAGQNLSQNRNLFAGQISEGGSYK